MSINETAGGALAGSSVYAFGDSIVDGHQYPRSFVDFVAEREGMTLTKYARNGATLAPSDSSGGQLLTQVQSASSQEPDFVVFNGGTNDAVRIHDRAYGIGTVSSSPDPATFHTSTFTGSLESTVLAMQQKWPTAALVYVAVHKMSSRDWDTQLALREAALQVADKWGVAVADVFADTAFDTRIDALRVAYTFDGLIDGQPGTDGDGTHPNLAGITEFYVPVVTRKLVELGG